MFGGHFSFSEAAFGDLRLLKREHWRSIIPTGVETWSAITPSGDETWTDISTRII